MDDIRNETDLKSVYYDIFASNTSSRSYKENYKILNLISSNSPNQDYYYNRTYAKNKDLFVRDSVIKDYEFNDGNILNFELVVSNIDTTATIFFE